MLRGRTGDGAPPLAPAPRDRARFRTHDADGRYFGLNLLAASSAQAKAYLGSTCVTSGSFQRIR